MFPLTHMQDVASVSNYTVYHPYLLVYQVMCIFGKRGFCLITRGLLVHYSVVKLQKTLPLSMRPWACFQIVRISGCEGLNWSF